MVIQESPVPTGAASTTGCITKLASSAKRPANTTTIANQSQSPLPPLATAAAVAAREDVRPWDRDWAIPVSVDVGVEEGLGVLRGRMREVSLLPSSLRLDLLLSATGSSFCSSSDWQSVLSQAVLLARVGQASTNTLFSRTFKYKHGCITTEILYVHMHTCTFHA